MMSQDVRELSAAPVLDNRGSIIEVGHLPVEGTDYRRIHTFEDRKHFVTYTVAAVFYRGVGLIFAVKNLVCEDVTFYLLTGKGKKRTKERDLSTSSR